MTVTARNGNDDLFLALNRFISHQFVKFEGAVSVYTGRFFIRSSWLQFQTIVWKPAASGIGIRVEVSPMVVTAFTYMVALATTITGKFH
jgi:hypothetical protein